MAGDGTPPAHTHTHTQSWGRTLRRPEAEGAARGAVKRLPSHRGGGGDSGEARQSLVGTQRGFRGGCQPLCCDRLPLIEGTFGVLWRSLAPQRPPHNGRRRRAPPLLRGAPRSPQPRANLGGWKKELRDGVLGSRGLGKRGLGKRGRLLGRCYVLGAGGRPGGRLPEEPRAAGAGQSRPGTWG